ncbi:hypothetical protein [Aquimarina longa]|uniref:hypothetical protein n=1 Tax=Aquimarina longa TaxID=1080221 RepID=UPI0007860D50|nr:hypothetical protein [Aquimarina longa]
MSYIKSIIRFYAKYYRILVFLWLLISLVGVSNILLTGLEFYSNYELILTAIVIVFFGFFIIGFGILSKHYTTKKSNQ